MEKSISRRKLLLLTKNTDGIALEQSDSEVVLLILKVSIKKKLWLSYTIQTFFNLINSFVV